MKNWRLRSPQTPGIELPSSLSVPLILKDGILYVDVTEVAPFIDGMQEMKGWLGFELGGVIEAVLLNKASLNKLPLQWIQKQWQAPAPWTQPRWPADGDAGRGPGDPTAFEKFMTITRSDDDEIDGAAVAVFVTKLDLLAFISSPEFVELVKSLATSGALGVDALSAADVDQAMQMLGMMGPMLFQGLTSENTTAVSIDEPNYLVAEASLFSWDLTSLLQMAAMSGAIPADQMPLGVSLVEFSTSVVNSEICW